MKSQEIMKSFGIGYEAAKNGKVVKSRRLKLALIAGELYFEATHKMDIESLYLNSICTSGDDHLRCPNDDCPCNADDYDDEYDGDALLWHDASVWAAKNGIPFRSWLELDYDPYMENEVYSLFQDCDLSQTTFADGKKLRDEVIEALNSRDIRFQQQMGEFSFNMRALAKLLRRAGMIEG